MANRAICDLLLAYRQLERIFQEPSENLERIAKNIERILNEFNYSKNLEIISGSLKEFWEMPKNTTDSFENLSRKFIESSYPKDLKKNSQESPNNLKSDPNNLERILRNPPKNPRLLEEFWKLPWESAKVSWESWKNLEES